MKASIVLLRRLSSLAPALVLGLVAGCAATATEKPDLGAERPGETDVPDLPPEIAELLGKSASGADEAGGREPGASQDGSRDERTARDRSEALAEQVEPLDAEEATAAAELAMEQVPADLVSSQPGVAAELKREPGEAQERPEVTLQTYQSERRTSGEFNPDTTVDLIGRGGDAATRAVETIGTDILQPLPAPEPTPLPKVEPGVDIDPRMPGDSG